MAKACRVCGKEIGFEEKPGGGWQPINKDGSHHQHTREEHAEVTAREKTAPPQGSPDRWKPCRTCQEPISWRDLNGKWIPVSLDGTNHNCEFEK